VKRYEIINNDQSKHEYINFVIEFTQEHGWNGKQASAPSRSVGLVGSDKQGDKSSADEARMTTAATSSSRWIQCPSRPVLV
jgi:hypothetical protein